MAIQWALLGGEDFILSVTADPRTAYRRYLVQPQRKAFFSCSQMPQHLAQTLTQGRDPRFLNSTYNPQRRDNHIMLKSLQEFAQSTDFLLLARCLLAEVCFNIRRRFPRRRPQSALLTTQYWTIAHKILKWRDILIVH